MEIGSILNSALALIFVLCLLGAFSVLLRKYANGLSLGTNIKGEDKIQILEVKRIDPKTKIAIIEVEKNRYFVGMGEGKVEILDKLSIDEVEK